MNENISWGKVVVLVVVIVGIGVVAFMWGKKSDEQPVVSQGVTPATKDVVQPVKQEVMKPVEKAPSNGIPADWKTYANEELGFSFQYPQNWHLGERWVGWVDVFVAKEQIHVLEIQVENEIKNTLLEHAKEKIRENGCPPQTEGSTQGDHIIRNADNAVLYVLYCSAMSESYTYEFLNKKNQLIKMTYHDDFGDLPDLADENKKLEKFEKIIQSLQLFSSKMR